MLRMQERTFPGFKFQKFSEGVLPQTPPFMRGILATHVAFSHCYPPLIYYLTERSLFKKYNAPPTGKSLKKALPDAWPWGSGLRLCVSADIHYAILGIRRFKSRVYVVVGSTTTPTETAICNCSMCSV